MYVATLAQTVLAGLVFHAGTAAAIFECNADQHAFNPTKNKFVVHYTSIRDSNYANGQPWVSINSTNLSLLIDMMITGGDFTDEDNRCESASQTAI